MDDGELVLAARSGDDEAFAAIYDRYADRIHDFCSSLLHDRDEAADAMQDTFVLAARRLGQLREPDKLRSWLFAIARHEALRHAKARRRAVPTEGLEAAVVATDALPEKSMSAEEARRLVAAATEGLADRDRALLDLHLRQGLDGQELADAIGVTPDHAYVLMSRMRGQFERSLGAMLVAGQGRDDCEDLQRVLATWDGTFTPLWRKRVARHVDGCAVCEECKRRLLTPIEEAAAGAIEGAPPGLREVTLRRARLALVSGPGAVVEADAAVPRGWSRPRARGGFPPSMYRRRRGRRAAVLVPAALATLVLVVGSVLVVTASEVGEHRGQLVSTGRRTSTTDASSTTTTPADSTTTSSPAPGGTSPTTAPAVFTPPALPDAGADPGGLPPDSSAPPAPNQVTPDTTPPRVSNVGAGADIFETKLSVCQPQTTSVSAYVSDDQGVVAVELAWSFPGSSGTKPMSGAGTGFVSSGTLGPFASAPQAFTSVTVTVRARDAAGNVGQGSTQATLQQCVI